MRVILLFSIFVITCTNGLAMELPKNKQKPDISSEDLLDLEEKGFIIRKDCFKECLIGYSDSRLQGRHVLRRLVGTTSSVVYQTDIKDNETNITAQEIADRLFGKGDAEQS